MALFVSAYGHDFVWQHDFQSCFQAVSIIGFPVVGLTPTRAHVEADSAASRLLRTMLSSCQCQVCTTAQKVAADPATLRLSMAMLSSFQHQVCTTTKQVVADPATSRLLKTMLCAHFKGRMHENPKFCWSSKWKNTTKNDPRQKTQSK